MIELLLEAERALSMGRADRAELLYQQVAAGDPRNSIAVVGLARVALERADDAGALVLARQALSIDGDNVAAQRLVQRLEEVLTTRGEALPIEVAAERERPAPPAGSEALPAEPGAQPEAPPPPEPPRRSTPFDGPDPVLGDPLTTSATPSPAASPTAARPAPPPAGRPAPAEPPKSRSLLDRLRRR